MAVGCVPTPEGGQLFAVCFTRGTVDRTAWTATRTPGLLGPGLRAPAGFVPGIEFMLSVVLTVRFL